MRESYLNFFACIEMDDPVEVVAEPLRSHIPRDPIFFFHQNVDLVGVERIVVQHLLLHATSLLSHSAGKIPSVKHYCCCEYLRIIRLKALHKSECL
jgi:hypothetical protein